MPLVERWRARKLSRSALCTCFGGVEKLPTLIRVRSSHFLPRAFHVVLQRRLLEVCKRGHNLVNLRTPPVFVVFRLKVPVHVSRSLQLCIFLSDRLLYEELVHATLNLLMVSAQESLNFGAHAQQKSVLTCAVVRLSPWPHVTVLCGLNCWSNSLRDAGGKGVTQVCSHQWLDEHSLLIVEHVCH